MACDASAARALDGSVGRVSADELIAAVETHVSRLDDPRERVRAHVPQLALAAALTALAPALSASSAKLVGRAMAMHALLSAACRRALSLLLARIRVAADPLFRARDLLLHCASAPSARAARELLEGWVKGADEEALTQTVGALLALRDAHAFPFPLMCEAAMEVCAARESPLALALLPALLPTLALSRADKTLCLAALEYAHSFSAADLSALDTDYLGALRLVGDWEGDPSVRLQVAAMLVRAREWMLALPLVHALLAEEGEHVFAQTCTLLRDLLASNPFRSDLDAHALLEPSLCALRLAWRQLGPREEEERAFLAAEYAFLSLLALRVLPALLQGARRVARTGMSAKTAALVSGVLLSATLPADPSLLLRVCTDERAPEDLRRLALDALTARCLTCEAAERVAAHTFESLSCPPSLSPSLASLRALLGLLDARTRQRTLARAFPHEGQTPSGPALVLLLALSEECAEVRGLARAGLLIAPSLRVLAQEERASDRDATVAALGLELLSAHCAALEEAEAAALVEGLFPRALLHWALAPAAVTLSVAAHRSEMPLLRDIAGVYERLVDAGDVREDELAAFLALLRLGLGECVRHIARQWNAIQAAQPEGEDYLSGVEQRDRAAEQLQSHAEEYARDSFFGRFLALVLAVARGALRLPLLGVAALHTLEEFLRHAPSLLLTHARELELVVLGETAACAEVRLQAVASWLAVHSPSACDPALLPKALLRVLGVRCALSLPLPAPAPVCESTALAEALLDAVLALVAGEGVKDPTDLLCCASIALAFPTHRASAARVIDHAKDAHSDLAPRLLIRMCSIDVDDALLAQALELVLRAADIGSDARLVARLDLAATQELIRTGNHQLVLLLALLPPSSDGAEAIGSAHLDLLDAAVARTLRARAETAGLAPPQKRSRKTDSSAACVLAPKTARRSHSSRKTAN